eukprot:tig00000147_g9474.t1
MLSPGAAAEAFDVLPDVVIAEVFKLFGLRAGWPLRGVCRRWRRLVEETEWASFELTGAAASVEQSRESAYEAAAALFEKRKLRLGGGGSVTLRPWVASWSLIPDTGSAAVEAVCSVLSAITHTHSGPAQPREVIVELQELFDVSRFDEDFLHAFLLGVLRALRPAEGAASGLESLSVGLTMEDEGGQGDHCRRGSLPWPESADLRAALAPFGGALRSLHLFFGPRNAGLDAASAAAIAAACPLLRSVLLPFDEESLSESLAALARLGCLEELAAVLTPLSEGGVSEGLAALADGAAGRSIRRISFLAEAEMCRRGEFPRRPEADSSSGECLGLVLYDAGLLALSRMPQLESIEPLRIYPGYVQPDAVRSLGRIAGLREASLEFVCSSSRQETSAALRALAEAVDGLPRLSRLRLQLQTSIREGAGAVAEFLGSAGARRALTDLELEVHPTWTSEEVRAVGEAMSGLPRLARLKLDLRGLDPTAADVVALLGGGCLSITALELLLHRPLSEAEAEAILALPALRRLRISSKLFPLPSLRPFEVLRGLRPEVAVKVDPHLRRLGREQVRALTEAVNSIFAGRPPI